MSVFNSLGSNYDFGFAIRALFPEVAKLFLLPGGLGLDLKKYLEEKYDGEAILLFKGREAITLALKLLDLPKNSQVAINGFTCYAVYKAIEKAGCKPVLIDIPRDDLNLTRSDLVSTLTKNPDIKVVIVQNTLGYPCDIDEISEICKEKNIFLIEDLAHSVGAKYKNGTEAGRVGDFVVLSFSQDKIIDGISGGALIIRNKIYQKNIENSFKNPSVALQLKDRFYPLLTFKIRIFYNVGGKLFHFVLKKTKLLSTPMQGTLYKFSNLPEWYCNLINYQFNNSDKELRHRRKVAEIYSRNLSKKILSDSIVKNIDLSANLRFPIFVENRQNLINYLKKDNIYISDIWYDAPIAPRRFMSEINYKNDCPNAEKISEKILNLPTHKNISEKQALQLSNLINSFVIHNS
ncbi:MAG: hypothetical protein A3H50_02240 [Candidatus Levybacteria bacterium RIFCSPLOWO2_02_FULL_37_10]|nr:MAG: hypothetical protein A3H50_02240 [Candidatus Levybacteria bacterium RIFCSPLOWO2_02_FULL_37_10]